MPKRIAIAPHLSPEELQARFRQAKTTTQAHHYQIIWLLAIGKTTTEVMSVTGYSRGWIYELVWGYNHLGPESLGDQRGKNRDRDPLLNDLEQAQLWQVLQQQPPDGCGYMVLSIRVQEKQRRGYCHLSTASFSSEC